MSTAFWTMTDANTGVPLFAPTALKLAPTRANANVIYANANVAQAFSSAVGVWGVDTQEASNTQVTPAAGKMAHAGWVQKTSGMGPVLTISANSGSYSPDGNIFVTFSNGGTGSTVANASIVTNGSKLITSVTLNTEGLYLTTPTAVAVNSNAVFTITMGGRANRSQYETLVAAGSITGNGAVIV
jgi:hypothetical protein